MRSQWASSIPVNMWECEQLKPKTKFMLQQLIPVWVRFLITGLKIVSKPGGNLPALIIIVTIHISAVAT